MSADRSAPTPQRRLTRIVFVGSVLIAVAALALSWYVDVTHKTDGTARVFALTASFGASALWWLILARPAEREVSALLKEQLDRADATSATERQRQAAALETELARTRGKWQEDVRRLSDELAASRETRMQEVALLKTELMRFAVQADGVPSAVYQGTDNHDLRFNRDLTSHLARSRTYEFHGPTGVYVGARLHGRGDRGRLERVRVRISDPRSSVALHHAARDRKQRNTHTGSEESDVLRELRDDIAMAIISLFDARARATRIEIVLDDRGVSDRIEHFTDALYVSTVATRDGHNFTDVVRWDRRQHQYDTHTAVCDRIWRHAAEAGNPVIFEPDSSAADLQRSIQQLTLDPGSIERLRTTYHDRYIGPHQKLLDHVRRFQDEIPHAG